MQFVNVPIERIHVPKVRMTAVYDEDLMEQFKSSLAAAGQLEPIIVMQEGEWYHLVDGLHRMEEAMERGAKTIEAVVYMGEERNALLFNIVSNRLRGKTKASEMVQVIAELTGTYHMDSDQITKETGLTRDYIERLWRIAEASPSVKEALDAEIIGVGVAYEIARLPAHAQQDELVATASVWRYTVADVKQFVDQVLQEMELIKAEPQPAQAAAAPQGPRLYECQGCKQKAEAQYLRAVLLCPQCFGRVWRLAKAEEAEQPVEVEAPPP